MHSGTRARVSRDTSSGCPGSPATEGRASNSTALGWGAFRKRRSIMARTDLTRLGLPPQAITVDRGDATSPALGYRSRQSDGEIVDVNTAAAETGCSARREY